MRFRDAEIRAGCKFEPATKCMAGQNRDDGLTQAGETVEHAVAVAHPFDLEISGGKLGPCFDIAARAESLALASK